MHKTASSRGRTSDRSLSHSISSAAAGTVRTIRAQDWPRIYDSPLALPLILVLTFAVFAPTLWTWFRADDFWLLESAKTTTGGTFIGQAFDFRDFRPVPQFHFYRPFYVITFWLSYQAFGLHAVYYHLLNLVLHLVCVVLVWFVVRRLAASVLAANFAALIFALHPAYTETVGWIARGNTIMTTFVYLLTMLAFMNYLDGGRRRMLYYTASVVGFIVAILYHTTAVTLVAVLPAYTFLMARKPAEALNVRSWLPFAPLLVMAAFMAAIQRHAGLDQGLRIGWHQYEHAGQYLGLALFPFLPEDWTRAQLPREALLPDLYILSSLVMIAATLFLLDRRQWPYRGVFAVVWLFALIAPSTTTILTIYLTGGVPAHLYLPGTSLGLFFFLVARHTGEILPSVIARRIVPYLPVLVIGLLVAFVLLGLSHEERLRAQTRANHAFLMTLRETLPPPTPGATLYVSGTPFNLVVFNNNALNAAIRLYYGDVNVQRVSLEKAREIKAADPTQLVFDYEP